MCGIVGIAATRSNVDRALLDSATYSLAHRGPDDSGTIVIHDGENEIGLGNRRLAILDLSPLGHQPMEDPKTGNWIVYNGEIFNFRELRHELSKAGFEFRSNSDTEVLLKAYAFWGEQSLTRLRGMFAFALWDASKRHLFIARDPMGVKPLYFGSFGPYFIFASEVRTLLGTGMVPRRVDRAGLSNYITFGSLYDPITLIDRVSSLCPGHYLIWKNGRIQETCYWDLVDSTSTRLDYSAESRQRMEQDLHVEIYDAVQKQMISDVPVGVFLSGGIDSSALVGILSQNGIRPDTFSIVFRESDYNEAAYSQIVAKHFETSHHEICASQGEALELIPEAIASMDLPTIDGVNTYFVSRKTREAGLKVALSGLGGDELFAGYSTFVDVPKMQKFSDFWKYTPGKSALAALFSVLTPENDRNRKLAALLLDQDSLSLPYFLARMLFTPSLRHSLITHISEEDSNRAATELLKNLNRVKKLDEINQISYLESRCYMLNTLLRDSDALSMANGLEVRVPLTDHQLARRAISIPGAWKIKRGEPKHLLVDALKGSLPSEIVHRRKRGFTLPFEHWLKDDLRRDLEKSFRDMADGPLGGVINQEAVWKVWQDFQEGKTSWSRPWSLHVLHQWCTRHAVTV